MLKFIDEFNAKPQQSVESLVLLNAIRKPQHRMHFWFSRMVFHRVCCRKAQHAVFKLSDSCRT